MSDNQNTSRRDFLLKGLLAATALSSCNDGHPFQPNHDVTPTGEKVKLLSVDGEIIEVDKAFLKPVPELPAGYHSDVRKG
ncbi:MAG: hypothetical protein ACOYOA_16420, partial [Saprospiraceae bacterium]